MADASNSSTNTIIFNNSNNDPAEAPCSPPLVPPLKSDDDDEHVATIIPELGSQNNVTAQDLLTAIRVLNAVAQLHPKKTPGGLQVYKETPSFRPLRKALAGCLEIHKLTMYNGKDEDKYFEQRKVERSLKRQKVAERELQKQYIAKTNLRKGRLEKLAQLQLKQTDEEHARLLIADGHVDTSSSAGQPLLLEHDDESKKNGVVGSTATLPKLRSCYCCKIRFRELHHFYDQLCPPCAALNFSKRHAMAPCTGKTAVVTGARVKIGFQTCLKLLRCGATVVATTRFPNSAVQAYRKEADFSEFRSRLFVYGLDLRDVTGVEAFTRFLKQQFASTGLDILVHNACQTIRRPAGYYSPLVEQEQRLWNEGDAIHRQVLEGCVEFERARRRLDLLQNQNSRASGSHNNTFSAPVLQLENGNPVKTKAILPASTVEMEIIEEDDEDCKPSALTTVAAASNNNEGGEPIVSTFETTGISHSAAMSQITLLPEDVGVSDSVFPPGATDINGQQLDLRSVNSWVLKMDQVSTPEVMECMFVNAIAPFVLNSRLKPLMCMWGNERERPDRYIVNVSAMEGKFNRYKTPNHPHTNMAKAALNMLTRTAAEDLAENHRIYMNAVDTGWINDENPLERAKRTAETNLFQTPIDEVDAAARILDPILSAINGETPMYGKFLKDYRETEW